MTHSGNSGLPFPVKSDARRRGWPFMLVVVGLSILAGWGGRRLQNSHTTDPSPSEPPVVERTFSPEQRQFAAIGFEIVGDRFPAPKLMIEDAQGVSRLLSDLKGGCVILEFWSLSCEPCRAAMPALQRLSIAEIAKHVTILPVCVDADDAKTAQEAMSQIAPGLTTYVDPTGIGIAQFDVQALPTTWLVDAQGQVCATLVGRIDWDSKEVRAAFEKMVLHGVLPGKL